MTYSSAGSNGWLGVGWALDGLSVIRRSSTGSGPAHWDADDHYAMDGRELVRCPPQDDAGSYNASPSCAYRLAGLSAYTTRIEGYQRIAFAPSDDGGRWFVWRTDGVKATYAPGVRTASGVLEWHLVAVEDASANLVRFEYGDPTLGLDAGLAAEVPVLTRIVYGDVEIRFQSERRPDSMTIATGDGLISSRTRLSVIDELASGTRVRAYALRYVVHEDESRRSFLQSVQQYGSDATVSPGGVTGGTALPAISFAGSAERDTHSWSQLGATQVPDWREGWADGPDDAHRYDETLDPSHGMLPWPDQDSGSQWLSMDANEDGLTDIVLVTPEPDRGSFLIHVELSSDDGRYQKASSTFAWPAGTWTKEAVKSFRASVADIDGDGAQDLVFIEPYPETGPGGRHQVGAALGRPTGQFTARPAVSVTPDRGTVLIGDATGDGKADVLEIGSVGDCSGVRVGRGDGRGLFEFSSASPACWPDPKPDPLLDSYQLADVNGDLKADVVAFQAAGPGIATARIYTAISAGAGRLVTSMNDTGKAWRETEKDLKPAPCRPEDPRNCRRSATIGVPALWGDGDGDGRADLVVLRPGAEGVEAWTVASQGDGTFAAPRGGATPFDSGLLSTIRLHYPGDLYGTGQLKSSAAAWLSADFNDDRSLDLAAVDITREGIDVRRAVQGPDGNWEALASAHLALQACAGTCTGTRPAFMIVGLNGDGRDDVLVASKSPAGWVALQAIPTVPVPAPAQALSGDLNADGRQDLIYPTTAADGDVQVRAFQQTDGGAYRALSPTTVHLEESFRVHWSQNRWLVADVNGDRRADLVNLPPGSRKGIVLLASGERDWTPRVFSLGSLDAAPPPEPGSGGSGGGGANGNGGDDGSDDDCTTPQGKPCKTHKSAVVVAIPRLARLPRGGRWSIGDVDRDGKDDLVHVGDAPTGNGPPGVLVLQGSSATLHPQWAAMPDVPIQALRDSLGWRAADVDADGAIDLVRVDVPANDVETLLRRGDSWRRVARPLATVPSSDLGHFGSRPTGLVVDTGGDDPAWTGMDVNGDGAVDLARVVVTPAGSVLVESLLSTADGRFIPLAAFASPGSVAGGSIAGTDVQRWAPADVDRDGRTDFVRVFNRSGTLIVQSALSNGDGSWTLKTNDVGGGAGSQAPSSQWLIQDVDGDGGVDAVAFERDADRPTLRRLRSAATPDLVTAVANGLGARTEVQYAPGTDAFDADAVTPAECRQPSGGSAAPTVVRIATSDAPSESGDETLLRYNCLRYSPVLHGAVAWTDTWSSHAGAVNRPATTEHTLRQIDEAGVVQPIVDELSDSSGVISRVASHYEPLGAPPLTDLLRGTESSECHRGTCATSSTAFEHDAFGNVTTRLETIAGTDGQQRRTSVRYLHDHEQWLEGLARLAEVTDPTRPSHLLSATLTCYDGDVSARCDQLPPTPRGMPTEVRGWDGQAGKFVVSSRASFDAVGNQVSATDARGNTTRTTFDAQLQLHAVRTCDALAHCSSSPEPWDRRAEAPMILVDVNDATTTLGYDALGRLVRTAQPNGAIESAAYTTDALRGTVERDTGVGLDGSVLPWRQTSTDGLGRRYRVDHPGGRGQGVVRVDTRFSDGSQQPYQRARPHFVSTAEDWETDRYDGLGRIVSTTHPDGSGITMSYDVTSRGLVTERAQDETGRWSIRRRDGWGRTVEIAQPSVASNASRRHAIWVRRTWAADLDRRRERTSYDGAVGHPRAPNRAARPRSRHDDLRVRSTRKPDPSNRRAWPNHHL